MTEDQHTPGREPWAIVVRTYPPVDGTETVGPFATLETAQEYVERTCRGIAYTAHVLIPPEAARS